MFLSCQEESGGCIGTAPSGAFPRGEGQSEVARGSGRLSSTAVAPDVGLIETTLVSGTVEREIIRAGLSEVPHDGC